MTNEMHGTVLDLAQGKKIAIKNIIKITEKNLNKG